MRTNKPGEYFGKESNPSDTEPFQNHFSNHFESFRINRNNVLNLIRCKSVKNQFDSIWLNLNLDWLKPIFRIDSEWFEFNPSDTKYFRNLFSDHSESIGTNRKTVLNLVRCKSVENQSYSVWFNLSLHWLKLIFQFELFEISKFISEPFRINRKIVLNLVRCKSVQNQSESILFNLSLDWLKRIFNSKEFLNWFGTFGINSEWFEFNPSIFEVCFRNISKHSVPINPTQYYSNWAWID